MDAWIESLAITVIFATALYVAVTYLIAIERSIAAYVDSQRLPKWTGIDGVLRPLRNELPMLFIARHQAQHPSSADVVPDRTPTSALVAAVSNAIAGIKPNAPSILLLTAATAAFAAIPFGYQWPVTQVSEQAASVAVPLTVAPNLDVGLLAVLSVCGLSVFLSLMQSDATGDVESIQHRFKNVLAIGLSALGIVLLSGSLRLETIIVQQAATGVWWIVLQPLGFAVFVVCALAEPFRQRLDGKSQIDSDSNGRIVIARYLYLIAVAYLIVILYFGGWHLWGIAPLPGDGGPTLIGALVQIAVLHCKVAIVVVGIIWLRNAKPRLVDNRFVRVVSDNAILLAILNFVTLAVLNQL